MNSTMPERGLWRAAAAAFVLVLTVAVPASAQDTEAPDESTTTTSVVTTTTVDPTTSAPVTTADGSNETTSTTDTAGGVGDSAGGETGGEAGGEAEGELPADRIDSPLDELPPEAADDPLTGEEPADEVPDTDVTVPDPVTYDGQGSFDAGEVLFSSVEAARAKLAAAQADRVDAVERVKSLRRRLKWVEGEIEALDLDIAAAVVELQEAEEQLRSRALNAFLYGDGPQPALLVTDYDDLLAAESQRTLVGAITEIDQELIERVRRLRESLDEGAVVLVERADLLRVSLVEAESHVAGHAEAIEQAERELEAFEAGSQIYIDGVVFPIQGAYSTPLIDSWGFPRMMGTADAHWHEGIDIFAPLGTDLVAAERGVVTRIGSGRLGGLRLWLKGQSGTSWYYAHLSDFAPGLTEGQVVEAGQVIGYVGNTGNALGTPYHLHMQVHPNGGDPINPYPLLKVISDRELAAAGG